MLIGWFLQLLTCAVCFNYIFCIRLPCDQTYEAKSGHLCYPCSPGYFKVSDCVVDGEQARCRRCGNGEYQPYCDNSIKCASCTLFCLPGQVIVKQCNATSNKECQCEAGSFWKPDAAKPNEGHCKPHSKCGPGEGMVETGTAYEDTKCELCREGFFYSDNSSSDNCKPCSVCNTTVIAKCTATHDVVCGEQFPQRPLPPKNLPTSSDGGIIAGIVISVAAVVTVILCRWKRNKISDPSKVDLSHISEESSHRSGYSDTPTVVNGAVETPKDRSQLNHSISQKDQNENNPEKDSTNSFNSQENLDHGKVNNDLDSQPHNENDTNPDRHASSEVNQNEPENEYVDSQQTTEKCTKIDIPGLKDKNPTPDYIVSELQEDSTVTVSGTESQQQVDPRSQIQLEDENEDFTVPHDRKCESKGTRSQSPPSSDTTTMQTDLETFISTPVERKAVPANEMVENEPLSNSCGENAPISTDAAAVSPRSFRSGGVNLQLTDPMSPLDDVSKVDTIQENESEVRNYTGEDSEEDRPDDTCQKERIWLEIFVFLTRHLKWSEFHMFILRLVAITNAELLSTIDVELEHAKEDNKSCKSSMYHVMKTWRQATPKAPVKDVFETLKDCSLNLTYEDLKKTLIQKGLLQSTTFNNMSEHDEETAEKQSGACSELAAPVSRERSHEMNELKVHEAELFC